MQEVLGVKGGAEIIIMVNSIMVSRGSCNEGATLKGE